MAIVCVLFACAPCLAQSPFGRLYVRVIDQTDAVLPGVTVTLRGTGIGLVSGATGILGDFCFVRLPPGSYDLTCELDGFQPHEQKQIRISGGATVSVKALMQLSIIAESVTVVAPAGVAELKPATSRVFTRDDLDRLPMARDPAGVAANVTGLVVDRADLGAFVAGRQFLIGGFGDLSGRNTSWEIEGLTITDMREIGTSPIQYDFDSIEQIEVTSGGVDPSVPAGGITLNLIPRSGDDSWNASARLLLSGKSLQSDNTSELASEDRPDGQTSLDGFAWSPSFKRPTVSRWYEIGLEAGGPLRRGRAWLWGAAGVQDIDAQAISGDPDDTAVRNLSLKLNATAGASTSISYTLLSSRRSALGPGYRSSRPVAAVLRTRNPSALHLVEVASQPRHDLALSARAGYAVETDTRTPAEGMNVPSRRDASGEWLGSYRASDIHRPQWEFETDALRHAEFGGKIHALKFGFSYRQTRADTRTEWPAGGVISDAYRGLARITRPAESSVCTSYLGLWAGDTFAIGPTIVGAGARYDRQSGELLDAATPGSGVYGGLLPAVSVSGRDAPFRWSDISPRLGVTFDLTGKGRTLLRASYARYADQLGSALLAGLSPISTVSELDYPWVDADGDGLAETSEIDFTGGPAEHYNIDPLDPASPRGRVTIDPSLSAPRRTEIVIGAEHEPWFGVLIGLTAIWKKLDNDTWIVGTEYKNPTRPYTFDDYAPAGYLSGTLPDGSAYSVPYYELRPERADLPGAGVDSLLANRNGYWEEYAGTEAYVSKSLANRWYGRASFAWQRSRRFYRGTSGIADPTNVCSAEDIIILSDVGGRAEYWIGTPRWHLTADALYQLPRGFDVSATFSGREGNPLVYFVRKPAVDPGVARKDVRAEPGYNRKLPAVWELDLSIAKTLTLGKANISLRIDVFNLLNRNTPLQVEGRLNAPVTNEVKDLVPPRTARAGVRVSF
ncbi:MAG: TonB-dependent receptor [Acidobacteriota bacterium]